MPCLWEHENALQRSQDPNKNKRCEDRRKLRWKNVVEKPPLRVSQICAYARSIEARVSQICAYAVIGLITVLDWSGGSRRAALDSTRFYPSDAARQDAISCL